MTIDDLQWIVNTLPIDVRKSKAMIDGREITAVVAQCDGSKVAFLTDKSKIKALNPIFVSYIPDNEEDLIRVIKDTYFEKELKNEKDISIH